MVLKLQTTKQVKFISKTNAFINCSIGFLIRWRISLMPAHSIFIENIYLVFSVRAARENKWEKFGFVYIESKPHLIETKTNRWKSFRANTKYMNKNTLQRRRTAENREITKRTKPKEICPVWTQQRNKEEQQQQCKGKTKSKSNKEITTTYRNRNKK